MDSRMPFTDQDPPAAAALYLSALDHENLYSEAELRHVVSRAYESVGRPAALLDLYRRSVQGAPVTAQGVRDRRRSWALQQARHLGLDDGRPMAPPPAWAAWEEPVTATIELSPHRHETSPSDPAAPPTPGHRQTVTLRELRAARRRPARVAASVLGAQMTGVVLANEAPGVMAVSLAGPLNIGLTLVLVQLVITGWAVLWYSRYARNTLEPLAGRHNAPLPHLESHR